MKKILLLVILAIPVTKHQGHTTGMTESEIDAVAGNCT